MPKFNYETFLPKYLAYVDGLRPTDDGNTLITVDQVAEILVKLRYFLERERVPQRVREDLADAIVTPLITAGGLTPAERDDVQRKLSAAIGFKVLLPS